MKSMVELSARTLALLWAIFWVFFFVAESVAWRTPLLPAVPWVGLGLLFVLVAFVPWRWETAGGALLVIFGLFAALAYELRFHSRLPASIRLITAIAFGLPPVAAGILFLMHRRAVTHAM